MMTIGLLVCGAFADDIKKKYGGAYEDFFIKALQAVDPSLSFKSYWVFEDEFPQSVDECDGWLVTGSKSGVYENLPWMLRLQDHIKESYQRSIPVVGVCFGHQILAAALGGRVEKASVGWGLGFHRYELQEPLKGIEGTLDLYAIHQDQVVELPKDARVLASNTHCSYAALAYKGRALSFQPHPEFSRQFETDLITSILGDTIPVELGEKAILGMENTQADNVQVMQIIADFFKG